MKAAYTYTPDVDRLVVHDAKNVPAETREAQYDGPITRLLDAATKRQYGWVIYSFSSFFRTGELVDNDELLPAEKAEWTIDGVEAMLSLQQVMQYVFLHQKVPA